MDSDKPRGVRPGGKSVLGKILKKIKERPDISEQPYDYKMNQDFFTGEIKGYEEIEPEERRYKIRGKEATLISMDEIEEMMSRGMKRVIIPVLDSVPATIPEEVQEVAVYNHKKMTVDIDLDELRMKWKREEMEEKWIKEAKLRAEEEAMAKMMAAVKTAEMTVNEADMISHAMKTILKQKPVPKQPDNTPKPECFGDWS